MSLRAWIEAADARTEAEVLASTPDAVLAFREGAAAMRGRAPGRAAKAFRKVQVFFPDSPAVARAACVAQQALGETTLALDLCRRGAADGSVDGQLLVASALPIGDRERQRLVEEALAAEPTNPLAWLNRCSVAVDGGDFAVAEQVVERLEPVAKDAAARCLAQLASASLRQNGAQAASPPAPAKTYLRRAFELDAGCPQARRVSVLVALIAGDLKDALAIAQEETQRWPEDPGAAIARALAVAASGDAEEAERELARAERLGAASQSIHPVRKAIEAGGLDGSPVIAVMLGMLLFVGLIALFGGWVGGFLFLVTLGLALSQLTLRAARKLTGEQSGRSVGLAAWLRKAYAVVLWLYCVYYYLSVPMIGLLVLGGAGAIMLGMLASGYIFPKLVIILLVVTVATLGALFSGLMARASDADPGIRLTLTEHTGLDRALTEVADRIGTAKVDHVFLTPGAEVGVFERGGLRHLLARRSERCLVLGAAVLSELDVREFKAILAHEYGHFSNRDTAGGTLAIGVRRAILTTAEGLAGSGVAAWWNPAWPILNALFRVFLVISHGASRLQEVQADRWAVFTYGSQAFAAGLLGVIRASASFSLRAQHVIQTHVEQRLPLANLYTAGSSFDASATLEEAIEAALDEAPSLYDSHPPPRERLATAETLAAPGAPPAADDNASAWSLLQQRERLEVELTHVIRQRLSEAGIFLAVGA